MKYRKKRRTKSISISSKRRRRSSGGERKERRITLENGSIFIAPIWRREHDQTGISRSALPGETKTMKRNSISTVQRFHRTHRNNQVPTRQAGDREREERKHFFSLHRDQHCDQCNKHAVTTMRREKKAITYGKQKGTDRATRDVVEDTPERSVFGSPPLVNTDCPHHCFTILSKIFVVDTRGIYSIIVIRHKKKLYTDGMHGYASPSVASQWCTIRYQS